MASRGRDIDRIEVTIALDPFLSLRALKDYSGLGLRTLRQWIGDSGHPLPCYRVGSKILVRRSEFDAWMSAFRRVGDEDLGRLVSETLRDL